MPTLHVTIQLTQQIPDDSRPIPAQLLQILHVTHHIQGRQHRPMPLMQALN